MVLSNSVQSGEFLQPVAFHRHSRSFCPETAFGNKFAAPFSHLVSHCIPTEALSGLANTDRAETAGLR